MAEGRDAGSPDEQSPPDKPDKPERPPDSGSASTAPADESQRGIDDVVREMSARAAQPGATEERLDAEYDARAGLTSFPNARIHAQRVYGGRHVEVNLGPKRELVPKYPMPPLHKEEAEKAFVMTDGHRQLLQEVSGRHVVLLRGARGSGKYALARKLVMQARLTAVFCFGPATDVSALRGEDFGKNTGYLLADLADIAAPALTAFEVQRLEQELQVLGSVLVITIPVGTVLADPALAKAIAEMRGPAEPAEVARCHLLWRAGPEGRARAERLLARADIAELIKKECDAGGGLSNAAQIGHMIAQAGGADDEVASRVGERLAMGEEAAFEHWFEGIADLETQCLAIAVAVFGGEPYDTVASLARRLQDQLQPPESIDNPERSRSAPILATRRRRLERLHATLLPAAVATRHGGAPPGLIVRFLDAATPVRVLDYVLGRARRDPQRRDRMVAKVRTARTGHDSGPGCRCRRHAHGPVIRRHAGECHLAVGGIPGPGSQGCGRRGLEQRGPGGAAARPGHP